MPRQLLAFLAGISLVGQGCSTHPPQRPAPAEANCYGGLPLAARAGLGPTELIVRQGYVLEHSALDRVPLWVCERVVADQLTGHLPRAGRFTADPDLKGPKSYPNDYRGTGYDRGHQAPAGNQTTDPVLKEQTFYMSNMAPQRPSLNRGIWKMLEDRTRSWVMRYGQAYEWTGPILCDPQRQSRPTGEPACRRQTIGKHAISVPAYFYKIVLVKNRSKWQAIAFAVPNTEFEPPYELEPYITSIDWIERQTGIIFMPHMAAPERRALKSAIAPMWP